MSFTDEMIQELKLLMDYLSHLEKPIITPPALLTVFCDASFQWWGSHIPVLDLCLGGRWFPSEKNEFINYLELLAILYALQSVWSVRRLPQFFVILCQ